MGTTDSLSCGRWRTPVLALDPDALAAILIDAEARVRVAPVWDVPDVRPRTVALPLCKEVFTPDSAYPDTIRLDDRPERGRRQYVRRANDTGRCWLRTRSGPVPRCEPWVRGSEDGPLIWFWPATSDV
jgi:hypothetical protein